MPILAQVAGMWADAALVPGLSDLPAKLLSQCGLINGVLIVAIVWLSIQLAKTRAAHETDRAGMMKIIQEQNAAVDKLAVAQAEVRGMLFSVQARGGDDD